MSRSIEKQLRDEKRELEILLQGVRIDNQMKSDNILSLHEMHSHLQKKIDQSCMDIRFVWEKILKIRNFDARTMGIANKYEVNLFHKSYQKNEKDIFSIIKAVSEALYCDLIDAEEYVLLYRQELKKNQQLQAMAWEAKSVAEKAYARLEQVQTDAMLWQNKYASLLEQYRTLCEQQQAQTQNESKRAKTPEAEKTEAEKTEAEKTETESIGVCAVMPRAQAVETLQKDTALTVQTASTIDSTRDSHEVTKIEPMVAYPTYVNLLINQGVPVQESEVPYADFEVTTEQGERVPIFYLNYPFQSPLDVEHIVGDVEKAYFVFDSDENCKKNNSKITTWMMTLNKQNFYYSFTVEKTIEEKGLQNLRPFAKKDTTKTKYARG